MARLRRHFLNLLERLAPGAPVPDAVRAPLAALAALAVLAAGAARLLDPREGYREGSCTDLLPISPAGDQGADVYSALVGQTI